MFLETTALALCISNMGDKSNNGTDEEEGH
jgi:hypothetical protein